MWFDQFETPIGSLTVAADADGLRYVLFPFHRHATPPRDDWILDARRLAPARTQLLECFAGERRHFEITLAARGSPFQRRVWLALADIPCGTTRSYVDLARCHGAPGAVRAVRAANGRNPLPIVVACHRVIGSDDSLTGLGGGLPTKTLLLSLERAASLDPRGAVAGLRQPDFFSG